MTGTNRLSLNISAQEKLVESRFFLDLMKRSVSYDCFVYFLSAFLGALYSAVEKQKKQQKDQPTRRQGESLLQEPSLKTLFEARRKETHLISVGKRRWDGLEFGTGVTGTHLELKVDYSSGSPVGSYRTNPDCEFKEHPVTTNWMFEMPDQPDVLETCQRGLDVVDQFVNTRGTSVSGDGPLPKSRSSLPASGMKGEMRQYVETIDGAYRVAGTRVTLDSIVYAFREGLTPESIRDSFPVLTLEEVYGAITFYLAHKSEIDKHLTEGEQTSDWLRQESHKENAELLSRLRQAHSESSVPH